MSHPTRGEWIEMRARRACAQTASGLTPHGVSGLKSPLRAPPADERRLTPHGVSGLKYVNQVKGTWKMGSHPTRGEWIEISCVRSFTLRPFCLTPHGVSGLKSAFYLITGKAL